MSLPHVISSFNLRNEMLPKLVHTTFELILESGIFFRITLASFLRVGYTSLRKTFIEHLTKP